MHGIGRSRRKLFAKKHGKKETGEMVLQITSMADIFTILLVFLLKGLSSEALQIAPSAGITLPNSAKASSLPDMVLQVEISKTGILVEKEFVTALENFRLPPKSVGKEGLLSDLNERLAKNRERQKLIAQSNDTVKNDSKVIILSDQQIPFGTLKPILRTLSAQGYSEIKFAVIKD